MVTGGRLKLYSHNWEKYTSDQYILDAVAGYKIEFANGAPSQCSAWPRPYKLGVCEIKAVDQEIVKLKSKGVIEPTSNEGQQYISNIFTRPKKDGGYRMILDLSQFNEYVEKKHFKMETFANALTLISPGDYMASVDLKDAYYTVPISEKDSKFLKFVWKDQMYKYVALPNGLSAGPRLFTKILKPPLSVLRNKGHMVMAYIDDLFCVNSTADKVKATITETCNIFQELGFIVHPVKSQFEPSQTMNFLGFTINTVNMTVSLPAAKQEDIIQACDFVLQCSTPSIRDVSVLIGKMISALPAVQYGKLHYRALEKDKITALKNHNGHFDRPMVVSEAGMSDIIWWKDNIQNARNCITRPNAQVFLESDASKKGWGASNGVTHIGGRWNETETELAESNRINYLELLAAFYALKSFCKDMSNVTVLIRLDNTTAVAYIQKMGGTKSTECNLLAKDIWNWSISRNIWVIADHLPGKLNVVADRCSRQFQDETEWMLNRNLFKKITGKFGVPDIDLFASRLNNQLDRYISWKPDPGAEAVNAFTLDWSKCYFYAFPPFALIGRCLTKIMSDKAEGILVAPKWTSQYWYPKLMQMQVGQTYTLCRCENLLMMPNTGKLHPLNNNLDLLVCRLSGNLSRYK